ncbi:MAG TPA: protein kinase [Gemmataceae bacterium]|nr:protein kinase [Gemmataceae bacterium]
MVTTELGACEWFIWDLRRSNLIDRGTLDQIVGEFMQANPRAEPPALAEYLVHKGTLSQFQIDRLLQGKTQGFVLGPFTLMDAMGAGSMGTVYKAQSKNDHKFYAVKVLPRRSMWNVRIARRKVRAFEACRHPAVVPFVDVGTAGGMHYLAWPFVEGEGLDKVVQAHEKLSPGLTAYYGMQVAEALEICHQQALFHGLLKPSNLMVGANGQIYILDFGIGCLLSETEGESLVDTMSTANSVTSGLDCASPESIMDPTNLTPAGDQYSLGCVLYYCLTGQYPFPDGSAAEKMMAHQFKEPTPIQDLNPDVPTELVEVVHMLMQKTPGSRYASAAAVVEALRPLAQAPTLSKAPAPPRNNQRANVAPRPAAPPRFDAPTPEHKSGIISPSSHTPKPQGTLSLPNRQTFRGGPAPATQIKPPVEKPRPPEAELENTIPLPTSWDDKLGPAGIVFVGIITCVLVWMLVHYLL